MNVKSVRTKCPSCGSTVSVNDQSCRVCGAALKTSSPASSPASSSPASSSSKKTQAAHPSKNKSRHNERSVDPVQRSGNKKTSNNSNRPKTDPRPERFVRPAPSSWPSSSARRGAAYGEPQRRLPASVLILCAVAVVGGFLLILVAQFLRSTAPLSPPVALTVAPLSSATSAPTAAAPTAAAPTAAAPTAAAPTAIALLAPATNAAPTATTVLVTISPTSGVTDSMRRYTVVPGDSCFGIARAFKVDPAELLALNGFEGRCPLTVGQILKIPVSRNGTPIATRTATPTRTVTPTRTTTPTRTATPTSMGTLSNGYMVRPGDSCYQIARRSNVSLEDLIRVNGLDIRCRLKVGQVLVLP